MTCKDCLHYEACRKWLKQNCDEGFMCENFTTRSEWMHFPCKLGDTVYYITGIGNRLIKSAVVKEIIIDNKGIKNLYVDSNGYNFERPLDIFYLTYEKAKKALKEKKCW